MIRDLRETALKSPHGRFVFPRYEGFSFANVPSTILALFGVERVGADTARPLLDDSILEAMKPRRFEHVLLVLVDGLGFDNWAARAASQPFFKGIAERGSVTSLTAVFPSTTSASLTTLATGRTPQEHGLPEWMVYLEEIDETITSLPFKRWNSKQRDELLQLGLDASILFEGGTIFEALAARGVDPVSICHVAYAQSAYSRLSKRGSRTVSFLGASDLAVRLSDELEAARKPTFFYLYWDGLDTLGHTYSPHSREIEVELDSLSRLLTEQLRGLLGPNGRRAAGRTLLLVTADHGQTRIFPERTVYITDYPEVREALSSKRNGDPILPTGSMRDVFLHVRRGKIEETRDFLARTLEGKAEVWTAEEAFEKGLFGLGTPTRRFRDRVGSLLVLPYSGEAVWGHYPGTPRPHSMRGHHGGLSAEEMFIPFGEAVLGDVLGD